MLLLQLLLLLLLPLLLQLLLLLLQVQLLLLQRAESCCSALCPCSPVTPIDQTGRVLQGSTQHSGGHS